MVNKAIIVGRLGRDPELKYTTDGVAICNFSVATTEKWKDNEKTEWHRVVCFKRTAELCGEYLTKGSLAYIEGKLQTREWEKEGEKRYTTEIVAFQVKFLDSKKKDSVGGQPSSSSYGGDPDDIPF